MISSRHLPIRPNRKTSGFTLIELMIVIAIIALLAEIMFPVFSSARESARRTSCQSNLKQIGLGISQYITDSDSCYPYTPNAQLVPPAGFQLGWAYTIQPYVKSTQILHCPDDPDPTAGLPPAGSTLETQAENPYFTSYYYNFNIGGQSNNNPVPESLLTYTSSTVMNGDGAQGNAQCANYYDTGPDSLGKLRHSFAGANYLFADGHAKFLKPSDVLTSGGAAPGPCGGGGSGANSPTGSNNTFCIY